MEAEQRSLIEMMKLASSAIRRWSLFVAIVALAGATSGCVAQSTELYAWYDYEALLYDTYANPGKADPALQVERLSSAIERARAEGRQVAPGMRAQLGYALYLNGRADAAVEQFVAEKQAFPESTVLMDGMIERIARSRPGSDSRDHAGDHSADDSGVGAGVGADGERG